MYKDHPIFLESISFIKSKLKTNDFNHYEKKILERLIHTSGDFEVQGLLKFSNNACKNALQAIRCGAPILTDTDMAAIAIKTIAKHTNITSVYSAKDWVVPNKEYRNTKTSFGMEKAWLELSQKYYGNKAPIVVFGSSPTALEKLLDMIEFNDCCPSLIVGMPVGFIGVEKCKKRLISSQYPYIILESTRGGAAMAAATVNALLREIIKSE